ncbi:hypothetical protein FM106_14720 [Brachybacterium faecium]|nr:hypothetical protein FM106_14720 [Brachybacterium faecium]
MNFPYICFYCIFNIITNSYFSCLEKILIVKYYKLKIFLKKVTS